VTARYQQRADEHADRRDREARLSTRIARFRLATFIPGAALVLWSLTPEKHWAVLAAGLCLLAAFAVLVVWHARVDERVEWYEALRIVNLHGLARISRAWDRLPAAEEPSPAAAAGSMDQHPYAADLDLFGRASLMQWLGPAATVAGTDTLHRWLLAPADPDLVRARQLAVAELAAAEEWRERLGAHGRIAAGVRPAELRQFLAWAEAPDPFSARRARLLHGAVLALTAAIWMLIALHASGITTGAYWLLPIVAGLILSFWTAAKVHGQFTRAGAGQHAFARYAALFAHATSAPAGARYLRAIHSRFVVSDAEAPACMRRLNRILGFAELRSAAGIFHLLVHGLTLWDFHVFFALDRWRKRVGPHVRGWMEALGELDALSAFAQVKADNPDWAMPQIVEPEKVFTAKNLGHPLIPDERRVGNDVSVGPPGTLLLITGSNMSGKSTLLRSIGLNTVLAQAGAPVCATSLAVPVVDLETCIRVQDSLEQGLSYFMAALARLKGVVDRSERAARGDGRPVMYLLDEILQGTNTVERAMAVQGVTAHLLQTGGIGVITTHDLALAGEEPLKTAARLAHFTETVDSDGRMTFDYRLRPGLATSRNALRLMQLIGIDLPKAPLSTGARTEAAIEHQTSDGRQ
jgi:hypothetical protein